MIAVLDAAYSASASASACVTAADWASGDVLERAVFRAGAPAAYEPGQFWKRELPLLVTVLGKLQAKPDVVVIDGYVWLDGAGRRGLGAHLFEVAGLPVVGIAKTAFAGAVAAEVLRGRSAKPLFVTAAGMEAREAADCVRRMAGAQRIPFLTAEADRLARGALSA